MDILTTDIQDGTIHGTATTTGVIHGMEAITAGTIPIMAGTVLTMVGITGTAQITGVITIITITGVGTIMAGAQAGPEDLVDPAAVAVPEMLDQDIVANIIEQLIVLDKELMVTNPVV